MSINLSHFGLALHKPNIGLNSRCFRPPSWPPPKDWVCIEDKDGNAVSRYGDSTWNLSPWCGEARTLSFGDGPKLRAYSPVLDPENAELLRQLVAWRVWGPRAVQSVSSLLRVATALRAIIQVCSENKILASDLWRYPSVIDKVAQTLAPGTYDKVVAELERLRDARSVLGFELLDDAGIQRLKAAQPPHDNEQTEYIPPRIWNYVVSRVAECVDDYLSYQEQIEACFEFCANAYKQNDAVRYRDRAGKGRRNPFQTARPDRTGRLSGVIYYGAFEDTVERFGIKDVLERWAGHNHVSMDIRRLSSYLQVVKYAALVEITAFTLMRISEATSIRWNCLIWYNDPAFGRIPLIESATTKTDPDEKGLWVTSPRVERAINTLRSIAKMRLKSAGRWAENSNPDLITFDFAPWAKSRRLANIKPKARALVDVLRSAPQLLDLSQLTITVDDFKIAKAVCPTLNTERFQVGKPWHLAWHQFRRTGAVNMFASGEISDSSMQFQMKHLTRWQPLYYGRGNTALHLNDSARVLLVNAQYEAMGRQLSEVHTDRFISPYGEQHKSKLLATANGGEPVNLISVGDALHYEKAARKHLTNFRLTVLGGCMKNGQCDGDCISSVGDCAGGEGESPCINVLFDRNRADANQLRLDGVVKQLEITPPDTPRYRHLEQEKRGLENYFAYIRTAA